MKKDYPELEGKEIRFITKHKEEIGVITGCNYYIRLTIQAKKDNRYLACYMGPFAPNFKKERENFNSEKIYNTIFFLTIHDIEEHGIFDDEKLFKIIEMAGINPSESPSVETCPFSQ